MHEKCECEKPNKECARYGKMIGRKWEHCQGINISEQNRDIYLDIYSGKAAKVNEPNIIKKGFNYLSTKIKQLINEDGTVSEEILKDRMSKCFECPNLNTDGKCNLCGCPIEDKAKIGISECPDNPPRWKRIPLPVKQEKRCGCK